jgi:hypothetical protein
MTDVDPRQVFAGWADAITPGGPKSRLLRQQLVFIQDPLLRRPLLVQQTAQNLQALAHPT